MLFRRSIQFSCTFIISGFCPQEDCANELINLLSSDLAQSSLRLLIYDNRHRGRSRGRGRKWRI